MTAFLPVLVSERYSDPHEAGWDNCVPCSISMLAAKITRGAVRITPQALEDRFDPQRRETGAKLEEVIDALDALVSQPIVIQLLSGQNDQLAPLLASGHGLALSVYYSHLPIHFQRWDPAFAMFTDSRHCLYAQLTGPKGAVNAGHAWLLDPLAPSGFAGEWIETADLWKAVSDRQVHAAGAEQVAELPDTATSGGPAEEESMLIQTTSRQMVIKAIPKGTPLFEDPAATRQVTAMSKASDLPYLGLVSGQPTYAVQFATAAGDPQGDTNLVIGFVRRDAVSAPVDAPPPSSVTAIQSTVTLSDGRVIQMHP